MSETTVNVSGLAEGCGQLIFYLQRVVHYLNQNLAWERKNMLFSTCKDAMQACVFLRTQQKFERFVVQDSFLDAHGMALEDYLWLLEQVPLRNMPEGRKSAILWEHLSVFLEQVDDLLMPEQLDALKDPQSGNALLARLRRISFGGEVVLTAEQKKQLKKWLPGLTP